MNDSNAELPIHEVIGKLNWIGRVEKVGGEVKKALKKGEKPPEFPKYPTELDPYEDTDSLPSTQLDEEPLKGMTQLEADMKLRPDDLLYNLTLPQQTEARHASEASPNVLISRYLKSPEMRRTFPEFINDALRLEDDADLQMAYEKHILSAVTPEIVQQAGFGNDIIMLNNRRTKRFMERLFGNNEVMGVRSKGKGEEVPFKNEIILPDSLGIRIRNSQPEIALYIQSGLTPLSTHLRESFYDLKRLREVYPHLFASTRYVEVVPQTEGIDKPVRQPKHRTVIRPDIDISTLQQSAEHVMRTFRINPQDATLQEMRAHKKGSR